MKIIGCDFHPSYQQIAMVDKQTGEMWEGRHRQQLMEMRTQVKNQLQHLALNQGVQRQRRWWSKEGRAVLEKLPLQGWTRQGRNDLLVMLDRQEDQVAELNVAVR